MYSAKISNLKTSEPTAIMYLNRLRCDAEDENRLSLC